MTPRIVSSHAEALEGLNSGMKVAVGGFGVAGVPFALVHTLSTYPVNNIQLYSNNPGGTDHEGIPRGTALMADAGQLSKFVGTHLGFNPTFQQLFLKGELEVELIPQGTFAERLRAGGAGIHSFYTPTGAGTAAAEGGIPTRYDNKGTAIEFTPAKETRVFTKDGVEREYVLEEAIETDFALIHAWKADTNGNLIFRKTARNFSADMAMSAKTTVVEVDHLVPAGSLDPDQIHLPGIFVDRIYPLTQEERNFKPHGIIQLRREDTVAGVSATQDNGAENLGARSVDAPRSNAKSDVHGASKDVHDTALTKVQQSEFSAAGKPGWTRDEMAARAALELNDGEYVNLGIGMPTMVADFIPTGVKVILQSENGVLDMGPAPRTWELDSEVCNAGKASVTINPGGSTFDSSLSFAMIRGGHIDTAVLGAFEVSAAGDIANWAIPGKLVRGMGGAMDLVQGAKRVVALLEHTDPEGHSRIVPECSYPLTGEKVVSTIVTNLCVFRITDGALTLVELAPGVTIADVENNTTADFVVDLTTH